MFKTETNKTKRMAQNFVQPLNLSIVTLHRLVVSGIKFSKYDVEQTSYFSEIMKYF